MPLDRTADPEALLARAADNRAAMRRLGFERLQIARDWALAHLADPAAVARNPFRAIQLGATGLLVQEFAPAELAMELEIQPLAARRLMENAVDLPQRHPVVWTALAEGRLEAWVGRKIADATSELSPEKVAWVDAQIADLVGTLSPGRLLNLVEAKVVAADQELADRKAAETAKRRGVWMGMENRHGTRGLFAQAGVVDVARFYGTVDHVAHLLRDHCPDLAGESMDELRARALGLLANPMAALKLMIGAGEHDVPEVVAEAIRKVGPSKYRPRTTCYLHLTPDALAGQGVTRAEELGVLTRQRLVDLLGHEQVALKPVIDLNEEMAADCYEVPAKIAEAVHLSHPADRFPFAQSVSRRQDNDHTVPYDPHGPPRQTRVSNLGHLTRHHHRIKTHAGWRVWQQQGQFTWITPHGRIFISDARGTHRVEIGAMAGNGIETWLAEYVLAS
jgi:hypothetical protein